MTANLPIQRRRRTSDQRGASVIKVIISLAILGMLAHTAYVFIPVYIAQYDFNSQVEREATMASMKKDDQIRKSLLEYAKERKIPLDDKNLRIARASDRITITANYTMQVPLIFGTYDWQITAEESGILF